MPAKAPPPAAPGRTDTVPAMLTPGEYVMRRDAVRRIGVENLNRLNQGVRGYQEGGTVTQNPPPELPPKGMAPGLGTTGGAPTDAAAKPVEAKTDKPPADWPDKPVEAKTDKPPADWPDKPTPAKPPVDAKSPPADWPDKPVEQPQAQPPPATTPPPVQPPQSQLPSQFQAPPQTAQPQQPQLQTDPETGTRYVVDQSGNKIPYAEQATPADKAAFKPTDVTLPPVTSEAAAAPQIPVPTPESPTVTDKDAKASQIENLIAQGKSPGEAQALAAGKIPKTIAGKTPPPKSPDKTATAGDDEGADTQPAKPQVTEPAKPGQTTAGVTPKAASFDTDKGQWDIIMPDGTTTHLPLDAYSGVGPLPGGTSSTTTSSTSAEQPSAQVHGGTVQGGNIKGLATSFGLNWDGSTDTEDNGIGAFGGANTRNPKLKVVAVPVDILEATFGHFTSKNPDGTYNLLDTPEAKKVIAAIRSAHVEALGLDGNVHKFPIGDIQGSLKGHPGRVLDMTPAAGRELGFHDNHAVSYQIVGGDGKPYAIDAEQLAAWNSGGGGEGGGKATLVPMAGFKGGSSAPAGPQGPLEATGGGGGGGGGGGESPQVPASGGGSFSGVGQLANMAAGAIGGALAGGRGQAQEEPGTSIVPTSTSIVPVSTAPGSPSMKQANVLGVRTVGAPPPAPSVPSQLPTPKPSQLPASTQAQLPGIKPSQLITSATQPFKPSQLVTPTQLTLSAKQPMTPQLLSPKQLMPGKVQKTGKPPPAAPGRTIPSGPAIQLPSPQAQTSKATVAPQQQQKPAPAAPTQRPGAITQKVQAWLSSLSGQEREAVDHFLAGRPGIQRGTDTKSAAWQSAIAKAPIHQGTVYRGFAGLKDSDLASLKSGTIHNQHDSSASTDPQNAKDFSRITFVNEGREPQVGHSVVAEINGHHRAINPEGSREIGTGVPYQKEVILPKGTDYKVNQFLENHYGPNQHHVVLDQVSPPAEEPKAQQTREPTEFTGGRPAGSTHGNPNLPGAEQVKDWSTKAAPLLHASMVSPDDPRVKKQKDGYIKGEHFVEGDPFHEHLLGGLPYGKQGPQRQKLGQAETAIADQSPMHISYISAPKEAEKFPTRESRTTQYEKSSPEGRLLKATEGALVGHSMIPLSAGVKLPTKAEQKAGDTHQGYLQGISTNVMANNFQHLNDKLAAMGRKTPYEKLGAKFANDLEGYYSNLLAGHTATGQGYITGTDEHPMEPDREHVPYKLTRKEADFINLVINNTSAFAQHDDAKKIRELARANGTLITEKGETNRLAHDIEQIDPGWHGRDKGGNGRVLEPSIKTFKTGLIHEIHPSEEHLPETIRPGKEYQMLTKALARTSARGRPDIAIGASLHHTFADNAKINRIEREFSEDKINEAQARKLLEAIGEDPSDYRFVGGSGGLITPYEDDPEALTPEEHTQMRDNLRQAWVGGKLNVEDYRRKTAEVPLPSKPPTSKAPAPKPVTETPSPVAPPKPKPPKPQPPPVDTEPEEPETPAPAPAPKPKAPSEEPEKVKSAAMRIGGKHYEGLIHADALENARNQGAKGPYESGFTTSHGRFIPAEEAWELGKKNKQLKEGAAPIRTKKGGPASGLTSADLKPEEESETPEPSPTPAEPPATPPAPDEPLPPVKPKKVVAPAPAAAKPAKLEKLIKPKVINPKTGEKEWEGVPEEQKQAYLEEKVKRTMANQIQDEATHKLEVQRDEKGGVKYDPNGSPVYVQHDYDIANSPMLKKKALGQIKGADEHEDTLGNLIGPDGKEVIDPETGKPVLKHKTLNQVERRRLSAMHDASAVHTMGDKIFDSYNEAIKNPDIAAGEGWYSRMRKKLGDALGEHHELFAQLLGATSAKTPVRTNFINALDAFEQYKEGLKDPTNMNLGFNKHISKFLEAHGKLQEGEGALTQHMRDQGILKPHEADYESDSEAMAKWIRHHKILPHSKIGNKYSANSNAVLKVLAGKWLQEVGAPKTPNFAGNLTGRTLEATIDVWAARHLQRLGYEGHMKGPWRAQSAAEPAVSNMDFAFSQDAMRHAADKIAKATGKQMNPDDLQAILWFAEKHHYEDRGWTRGQGAEKSSFDDVADRVFGKDGQPHDRPMDSTQLRAHYQAEAKALSQRKGKIKTAQTYLGTPHEQTKLPGYMQKHGLTHEEVHGAEAEDEEEAA